VTPAELAAIRKRHDDDQSITFVMYSRLAQIHADRAALLAHVAELERERDEARAEYLRRHHEYMDYRYGDTGKPPGAELVIADLRAELAEAKRDLRLCQGHDIVAKFRMLAAERDDLLDKLMAAQAERDRLHAELAEAKRDAEKLRADPEADLFSDEMDAAAAEFHAVRYGILKNASRANEQTDGEVVIRKSLAAAFKRYVSALKDTP
jgi:uncharacterized coiled-coil DUF342 family protein